MEIFMKLHEENAKQIKIMRKNFKLLREKKGWSIDELSRISRIDGKVLLDIESEEDFELVFLFTLCRIYDIKPHEVFLPVDIGKLQKNNI